MFIDKSFYGNIRKDHGGNIIIDTCDSDHDHLVNGETDPDTNKPVCRKALNHMFEELIGKSGTLTVRIEFFKNLDIT